MTKQLIIYLIIILSACGRITHSVDNSSDTKSSTTIDSFQTFSITKTTVDDFLKAKNKFKDLTLYDTTKFKKANGVLKLPIDKKWQPFVIFTDTLLNWEEGRIREYQYIGQFDNIGFYIVKGNFYEFQECYLIDKRTGNQTIIWNRPSITTNEKFIANLSMPFGLEGVPNGLQIWRVDRNERNEVEPISFSKYLELDQQIWVPLDFVWESNNSLILKVISVDKFWESNGQLNSKDYYFIRVKI